MTGAQAEPVQASSEQAAASKAGPAEAAAGDARDARDAQGLSFHPLTPDAGRARVAAGLQFDALDPQAIYGMEPRIPQFTADLKVGLGKGWFALGHINTIIVSTEILAGGGYGWRSGNWSISGSASAGLALGFLEGFGFSTTYTAPEVRPEITVGLQSKDTFFSLSANMILSYPHSIHVGGVEGTLEVPGPLTGVSARLAVENRLKAGGAWYFGAALLHTRAFYQMWILFPDSPGYLTYPRLVAGYEF